MATSNAQKRASVKWTKENVKSVTLALRRGEDDDIIEFIESLENRQAYIKRIIREDMEKTS